MTPTKIVFFNVFAATICAVAAYLNFTAGNNLVGILMCGLTVMNTAFAVINFKR